MVGIGIGAGGGNRTRRAEEAIVASRHIVGYGPFLDMISDLTVGKELIYSGMRQESERCRIAIELASRGESVALVSSGDAGIYGIAGLALEIIASGNMHVAVEIVPGVSASNAAAARFGAPLMLDHASISLSDLLVSWEQIRKRLLAVAASDLVTVLYNPKSSARVKQLDEAAAIFRRHRPMETPVGIGKDIGTEKEKLIHTDVEHFHKEDIDMRTVIIIGNSHTKRIGEWLVTPRGYRI